MPRKRGNGEGGIYSRTIKGNQYYIVEITIGFDENGKRIKKTTSAKSHSEAVDKLKKMQVDLAGGTLVKSDKITLFQWLSEYLNTFKYGKIKPTTFDGYQKLINHYFANNPLGKKQLQKLTTNDIQKFFHLLEKDNKLETIRKIKIILNMALKKAVQLGLIPKNVVDFVELPRMKKSNTVASLTVEEVNNLLRFGQNNRIYPAIKLALDTGLRRGELLALKWEDVDFGRNVLYVRQNIVETSHGKLVQQPKTEDSIRMIALLPETLKMLNELKSSAKSSYIFSQVHNDEPMSPRHFSKIYKNICIKAGLEKTGFHILRHTHATELLEAGIDIKVMSERIGHSDIRTTFNIYVHPSEEFHKLELEKLQNKRAKAT